MSRHLATLTQDMRDEQRLRDLARNDEADAQFDTSLHRIACRNCPGPDQDEGRDCECCREASEAALRGLWTTVRNTVRAMNTGDWLAVLAVICALGAYWSH